MKKIETYQCEVCKIIYDNEEEARKCEAKAAISKFKIGEVVYVHERYPQNNKPYVKRTILNIIGFKGEEYVESHVALYELDKIVEVGKDSFRGGDGIGWDYNPIEGYLLYKLGDLIDVWNGKNWVKSPLTEEMVNYDN